MLNGIGILYFFYVPQNIFINNKTIKKLWLTCHKKATTSSWQN